MPGMEAGLDSKWGTEQSWRDALEGARRDLRFLQQPEWAKYKKSIEDARRRVQRIRAAGLPEWQERDHGRDDWPRLP